MCVAWILSAQTIAPKKCSICGKPLAQCQYKGKHPTQQPKPVKKTTGTLRGHEWVDLGLPSGTRWATMNVGASSPSDYGNYYAWGETSIKSIYTWETQKYQSSGNEDANIKLSKYVLDSKYGNVDGKRELDSSDDAAYVNWGSGWSLPSHDQIEELKGKCTWIPTTSDDGHWGYKVVGSNGNFIFLPAAGASYASNPTESSPIDVGLRGHYWSRSLNPNNNKGAYTLYFYSNGVFCYDFMRRSGYSVRAVCFSD